MVISLTTGANRLRSWHVAVAGLVVQAALGAWVLWAGVGPEAEGLAEAMATVIGGVLLVLVVIAAILLLPALWMLYVGRYRGIAVGIMIVVSVGFIASLRGSPALWPLPAFLVVASGLAWRERIKEAE